MKKLKKILKNLLFVTLPMLLVLFLLLEVISRIFFPGKDAPKSIFDKETRLVKYNRDYGTTRLWTAGRFAQQRARWRINNDGWNSPIDFFPEKKPGVKRIAVFGDSYIEAWQVDNDKAYPNLLDDSLGSGYEVYRFGVSGAPLSHYLFMARYAQQKYSPDIVIFNLIHNDFHESINGLSYNNFYMTVKFNPDSSFTEIEPVEPQRTYNKVPGGAILRKSSFFRWVYYNLNLMERFKSRKVEAKEVEMNVGIRDVINRKDSLRAATEYLVKQIKSEFGNKEIIFVMDAPRRNIYSGDLAASKVYWLNTMASDVCREQGLPFIDLTPYMEAEYKRTGKHFETDYDGHWSPYGHEVVASAVYDYFKHTQH